MTTLLIIILTMMIFMNHPLSLILSLIISTLIISYSTFIMSKTSLFSYMIILALLGGMVILFIYMASLTPNMNFSTYSFNKILILSLLLSSLSYLLSHNNKLMLPPISSTNLMTLYNSPLIMLLITAYLFITLIAIISMTSITQGPLRSK